MHAFDLLSDWPVDRVSVAVVSGDQVVATYGSTSVVQRIASVSKPLVSWAWLVALEEGSLSLDAPAGPPGSTVEHLFAHTSGYDFDSDAIVYPVGTKRGYSNQGWLTLAQHHEAFTSIPTDEYLAEAVLAPLGMRHSELNGHPGRDGYSNVDDLATFAIEILRPTLIGASTASNAMRVHFPGLGGVLPGIGRFDVLDWGLGFQLNSSGSLAWAGSTARPSAFGHFGATGSFLLIEPELDLGCVALADRDFGPWSLEAWPTFLDAVRSTFA